jgi:DNA-binding NtrC family response regulator
MPQPITCTHLSESACDRELHYAPETFAAIAVLALTPSDGDWYHLQHLFDHSRWRLERCRSMAEARQVLLTSCVPTVLCNAALPDGDWKGLVEFLSDFRNPPRVIVMSDRADDRLWDSVVDMGGCDLLETPLDPTELYHAVIDAWHGWNLDAARDHWQEPVVPAQLNRGE